MIKKSFFSLHWTTLNTEITNWWNLFKTMTTENRDALWKRLLPFNQFNSKWLMTCSLVSLLIARQNFVHGTTRIEKKSQWQMLCDATNCVIYYALRIAKSKPTSERTFLWIWFVIFVSSFGTCFFFFFFFLLLSSSSAEQQDQNDVHVCLQLTICEMFCQYK